MPEYLRQKGLEERVAELERQLAALARTNQIGATTLTNGNLVLRQGASIVVMSAQDPSREVARIGDIGLPDVNGTRQMGLRLRRDTPGNELLFAQQDALAWSTTGFGTQGLAMYDRAGNVIISADTISGKGVSFPWRPVGFGSTSFWTIPRSYASTWEEVAAAQIPRDSPRFTLQVGFVGDQIGGVNTGGDYRIVLNTDTTVAIGSVPATFNYVYATPTIDVTPWYGPNNWVSVSIQVQRTSGATTGGPDGYGGSIRCAILGANLRGA